MEITTCYTPLVNNRLHTKHIVLKINTTLTLAIYTGKCLNKFAKLYCLNFTVVVVINSLNVFFIVQ